MPINRNYHILVFLRMNLTHKSKIMIAMLHISNPHRIITNKTPAPTDSIRSIGASTQSPTIFRPKNKDLHNYLPTLIKELIHSRTGSPTIRSSPKSYDIPRLKYKYIRKKVRTSERGGLQSRSKKSLNVTSHTANVITVLKGLYNNISN